MPAITLRTLKGRGAAVRAAGLKPLKAISLSGPNLRAMTERLYLEARCGEKRLAQAITLQAGALGFELTDENVWGRVFQRFIKKGDFPACAWLMISLGHLLYRDPMMGPDLRARQKATADYLGRVLSKFDRGLFDRIIAARPGGELRQMLAA